MPIPIDEDQPWWRYRPVENKGQLTLRSALKKRADDILARPNARFPTGDFNPRVVSRADAVIIAQAYPNLPKPPGRTITGFEAARNVLGRTAFTEEEIRQAPGWLQPLVREANEMTSIGMLGATALTAGVGPAAAMGLRGLAAGITAKGVVPTLSRATLRTGAAALEPVVRGGFSARMAAEQALGVGAGMGARAAAGRVPETAPTPVKVAAGLAGGLVAGAGGLAGTRAAGRAIPEALVRVPQRQVQEAGLRLAGGQAVAGGAARVGKRSLLAEQNRIQEQLDNIAVQLKTASRESPTNAPSPHDQLLFREQDLRGQLADVSEAILRLPQQTMGKGPAAAGPKPPTKPVAPVAKEPWEMTFDEFLSSKGVVGDDLMRIRPRAFQEHKQAVTQALREGKPVSDAVLERYPSLVKLKAPSVAPVAKAVRPARGGMEANRQAEVAGAKGMQAFDAEVAGGVVRKEAAEHIAAAPSPVTAAEQVSVPVRRTRARVTAAQQAPPPPTEPTAGVVPPSPAAAPPTGPPRKRPPTRRLPPPPEEPFAANIRLSKYPEDIRGAISDWAAENASTVQEARRGVRSDVQVLSDAKALVEEMGGDFARIQRRWKPGEAWNAEEITAIRGVLRQKTVAVLDAAKASRTSNSDENLANLMIALKEQSRVQEIVHGVTAEAGRSLRAFRQAAQEMAAGREVARFEELLKRLGGRENLTKYADLIANLDLNDPVAVNNFIRATQQPKFTDYLTEFFINSILSGPATHLRNMLGNTGATLTQLPERALAAGVERVLAPLQRRQIERFWQEAPAAGIGALQGLDEGTRGMLQVLKTGQRMQDATKIELLEFRTRAFTGPLGRVINAPTNAMEAADALFYSVNFRASLSGSVVRKARMEGLRGQVLIDRIAELKSNPTQELLERAAKEAETRLFRNDPGPFVSELMRLRTKYPPLRFIVPFVRTPANLITFGLARSPAGFLNPGMYRNLATRNPEAADQIARALMGSMVAGTVAWQFIQGNITAQAPSSAAERDRFYREGKQPWSIRIGGHWVSYRDFEPFSITLGLISSAMTAIEEKGEEAADATTIIGRAVTEMGRFLLDRSFFTGLSDTLSAVQEPERYGSRWLQRMAGAAVPFSALLRQIAQTADPTFRKAEGVLERLETNIPGLTGRVPGRVTAFGETPERPSPALFPVQVSKSRQSAVDAELDRLGIEVGFVGKTIEGVELSRSQQLQYQIIAGQETLRELEKLIGKASYQDDREAKKQDKIEDAINNARKEAHKQMGKLMESPASQPTPSGAGSSTWERMKQSTPAGSSTWDRMKQATPEPAGVR